MSVDLLPGKFRTAIRKYRLDPMEPRETPAVETRWPVARLCLIAAAFLLIGGGSREPSDDEARLGLAAAGRVAPFGQAFGGWEPSLSPARCS